MSNGIGKRQNEEKSLAMLAAQRQLYNECGRMETLNFFLLVILPLLLSFLQELGEPWSWIRFLSYGLSLVTLGNSSFVNRVCKGKKRLAASIQMVFDIYVYNMPWDKKLFGINKNINVEVVKKSKRIMNNDKQKAALKNWYTPKVDELPLLKGIFSCQQENYQWDVGLRRRYKRLAVCLVMILLLLIVVTGTIKNEPLQEFLVRLIFVLPMVRWMVNLIEGLNEDIKRLKEMEYEFYREEKKNMDDLQNIQKLITEHRKAAVNIPNCIYKLFKENDEDTAHRIVEMNAEHMK